MCVKQGWSPPKSPFSLLQEELFPDEWLILVACMMLNRTSRKQVEPVLAVFSKRWPTPETFLSAKREDVVAVVTTLGFKNRRTDSLLKMTAMYVQHQWTHVSELPGIGDYASRAWEMFCAGTLGVEPPNDHALVKYYSWAKEQAGGKED